MFYFRDFSKPEPPGGYWENLKIKTIGVMDGVTFNITKDCRKLYAWGQKIPYVDYENHPSYREGQGLTILLGGKAASVQEANLKKFGTSEGLGNWEIAKNNGNIGKTEIIPKNNVINVRNNKIKQVNKEFGKKGTKPKKVEAKGKDDAHFGENNGKPETGKTMGQIVTYNPKFAVNQILKNGKIKIDDLNLMVRNGSENEFISSETIKNGYKYNYNINGTKVEIKWHSIDKNAAMKFPNSNSGNGWTAQIKIAGKLLGQDGKFYRKPSNMTHIPVEGIK